MWLCFVSVLHTHRPRADWIEVSVPALVSKETFALAQESKRELYYYRCLGADAYRRLKGALCRNRPVRSDYLDKFVWDPYSQAAQVPSSNVT